MPPKVDRQRLTPHWDSLPSAAPLLGDSTIHSRYALGYTLAHVGQQSATARHTDMHLQQPHVALCCRNAFWGATGGGFACMPPNAAALDFEAGYGLDLYLGFTLRAHPPGHCCDPKRAVCVPFHVFFQVDTLRRPGVPAVV